MIEMGRPPAPGDEPHDRPSAPEPQEFPNIAPLRDIRGNKFGIINDTQGKYLIYGDAWQEKDNFQGIPKTLVYWPGIAPGRARDFDQLCGIIWDSGASTGTLYWSYGGAEGQIPNLSVREIKSKITGGLIA